MRVARYICSEGGDTVMKKSYRGELLKIITMRKVMMCSMQMEEDDYE